MARGSHRDPARAPSSRPRQALRPGRRGDGDAGPAQRRVGDLTRARKAGAARGRAHAGPRRVRPRRRLVPDLFEPQRGTPPVSGRRPFRARLSSGQVHARWPCVRRRHPRTGVTGCFGAAIPSFLRPQKLKSLRMGVGRTPRASAIRLAGGLVLSTRDLAQQLLPALARYLQVDPSFTASSSRSLIMLSGPTTGM